MTKSLLTKLQEVAAKALGSNNVEEGMRHLATAFSLFSKESEQLKSSYLELERNLEEVKGKLKLTNIKLLKKIKERDILYSYLDGILKNISQGIIFIDRDAVVTTINPAAETILEVREEEVLFKSFFKNFQDNIFGFSIKRSLSFALSNNPTYISLKSKKQIEVSSTFIPSSGLLIVIRDISEVKRLELIASRNDRMKELGEMAASVAHEIRNPLGGIRGYASLLKRNLEKSKHLQDMAEYIIEGTKTLERLVNNVLHFSRPINAELEIIDICPILKEIYNFIKIDPSFPKSISLEAHIPNETVKVAVDKALLKSAILNLIVNAMQAIEDEGRITLSLLKQNKTCSITVSDTGCGIDKNDLENIFSPFFTTKPSGNGLGLSETYKIIEALLGNIDVRSTVDIGTTFTITLQTKD